MRPTKIARAAGTGGSVPIKSCQMCGHAPLDTCFHSATCHRSTRWCRSDKCRASFPGFRPRCCIATIANWSSLASRSIRSLSSRRNTPTPAARPNCCAIISPTCSARAPQCSASVIRDLVVDIGSNDGTLLSNFQKGGQRVLGIEPTDVGDIANQRGIPTIKRYFGTEVAREVKREYGPAVWSRPQIVLPISRTSTRSSTASSRCSKPTAYSSPNRTISFRCSTPAIRHHLSRTPALLLADEPEASFEMHGLEVFHARPIPSHGGSIRVYAARRGAHTVRTACARCCRLSRAAKP